MVADSQIQSCGDGCFTLSGELGFATVGELLQNSQPLFRHVKHLTLDLSAVTRTDSAGLALLIEWMRQARQHQQSIIFSHVPAQLQAVAKVVGLDVLLPTQAE